MNTTITRALTTTYNIDSRLLVAGNTHLYVCDVTTSRRKHPSACEVTTSTLIAIQCDSLCANCRFLKTMPCRTHRCPMQTPTMICCISDAVELSEHCLVRILTNPKGSGENMYILGRIRKVIRYTSNVYFFFK